MVDSPTETPMLKEFTHGVFSRDILDVLTIKHNLPLSSNLLSFFAVPESVDVGSACGIQLIAGEELIPRLRNSEKFQRSFSNRREVFFSRVRHALVFAIPMDPMSMTMISTTLMCSIEGQLEFATIVSATDLSPLLDAGTAAEQARVSQLRESGKLLISTGITEKLLIQRLSI